jgi:hypothetical protein
MLPHLVKPFLRGGAGSSLRFLISLKAGTVSLGTTAGTQAHDCAMRGAVRDLVSSSRIAIGGQLCLSEYEGDLKVMTNCSNSSS